MKPSSGTIQKIILLFWSIWFTLISISNTTDGLKAAGLLPHEFKFASGNFDALVQTTAKFDLPMPLNVILFMGVLLLEYLGTFLFWKAFKNSGEANIYSAYSAGLILFAGFIFADEIFISYALEGTHIRIFMALLISLVTLIILKRYKETPLQNTQTD